MESCCMPHMRSLGPASGPGANANGGFFKCCCCHADFSHRQEFEDHMLTEGHQYRMQRLMQHHLERTGHQLARLRAEEHLRMIEGKHSEDYCRICDKRFPGLFIHHRRSQEHRRKERLTKRGCKLCETGQFSQYPDYVQHIDSEMHKKRKEELQYVQQALQDNFQDDAEDGPSMEDRSSIGSSSLEDHENTVPVHRNGLRYERSQNTQGKRGGEWDVSDSVYPSDAGVKRLRANNEDVRSLSSEEGCDSVSSDGSEFIAPTQALFCQLCDQFFLTETGAKDKHCRSKGHQERYKAKMMTSENNNCVSRRAAACSSVDDRCPPNITNPTRHMEEGALAAAGKYLAIKVDHCDMLESNDRENNQAIAKQLNSAVKMEIKYKNGEFIVRPLSSRFNQVESTRSKDVNNQGMLPSNSCYGDHTSNNGVFNSPAIYS